MRYIAIPLLILGLFIPMLSPPAMAQGQNEVARLETATAVLREIMSIPEQGIPADLLRHSFGIAVIPNTMKVGLGIGGTYGQGIMVVRTADGSWSEPGFVTLSGGSLGFQAGVESSDLVLVFKTPRSVEAMHRGKFILGGTVSIAAGPVGRTAEANTDAQLAAEVYSYSRSRGLFAGVALQGAQLAFNYDANRAFYGVSDPIRTPARSFPMAARTFSCIVAQYTGAPSHVCA